MSVTPGRLHVACMPLASIASIAWGVDLRYPIEGGPAWSRSDPYNIEAEAQGTPPARQLQGVMLQALLEERFQLKVRRETRDIPIYALTVAKKGFPLRPLKEGACTPFDPLKPPDSTQGAMSSLCADGNTMGLHRKPATGMVDAAFHGITLDEFAKALSRAMDRKVVNRSEIAGRFDIQMQFGPDEAVPAFMPGGRLLGFAGPPAPSGPVEPNGGPSIFTAIQEQLGLKLDSAKAPGDFFVIESAEKPSEN